MWHFSYLISQTDRITEARGGTCSTFCISTIFLVTNVSFNKNHRIETGPGGKPTKHGLELRQFSRKWKVELSVGNIKILIIICQTPIYIVSALVAYLSIATKTRVSQLFRLCSLSADFQTQLCLLSEHLCHLLLQLEQNLKATQKFLSFLLSVQCVLIITLHHLLLCRRRVTILRLWSCNTQLRVYKST